MALGEASADITLDFNNFTADLRRQLDRAIILAARRGRAAGTAFGRAFNAAARGQINNVFARTALAARAAAVGRQAGAQFAASLNQAARSADIDLTDLGRRAGETLRRGLDSGASGSVLPNTLRAITSALAGVGRGVRLAGLTSSIALLAGAAASASVAVLKLGLSISQTLGPALAALGTLASTAATQLAIFGSAAIVGAGLVLTTLKLALNGVGDALSAVVAGDADKLKKSLEGLTPAVRSFVRTLADARFGLDELREEVQQATFTPLVNSAKQIVAVLPQVSQILTAVGFELGTLAADFIRVSTSAGTLGRISSVAATLTAALSRLRPAVEPLVSGFTRLAQLGSSAFVPLADAVTRAAQAFERWVTVGVESGRFAEQLSQTMSGLREVFRSLAAFGSDIATIFQSIGAAARAAGVEADGLFGAIGRVVGVVADFVSSAEGMEVLTSIFRSLNTTAVALQPAILAVLRGLEPLAQIFAELAVGLGPGLVAGIEGLVEGLRMLIPAAKPVGEAIGGILQVIGIGLRAAGAVLGPFLTAISTGLNVALKAAIPILQGFAQIFIRVGEVISDFFGSPQVLALIERTSEAFATFGTQVGDMIARLAPLIANLVDVFLTGLLPVWDQLNATIVNSGLFEALGQLATAFGTLLTTALTQLAPLITQVLGQLGQIVTTVVVPALNQFLTVLVGVIGQIATWLSDPATSTALTAFITSLGEAFTDLFKQITPLLPQLAALAAEFGGQLAVALLQVIPLLPPLIVSVVRLFAAIVPLLPKLLTLTTEFLQVAVQSGALERILKLVIIALNLLVLVVASSISGLNTFVNVVTSIVSAFRKVKNAVDPVIDAVKEFIRLVRQAGGLSLAGLVLPKFDQGGIIGGSSPIVAQLHPNEVIIPLSDPRRAAQLAQQSGLIDLLGNAMGGTGVSGSGVLVGPGAVQVTIQGDVSPNRARAIGKSMGEGLVDTLSQRMISNTIRRI